MKDKDWIEEDAKIAKESLSKPWIVERQDLGSGWIRYEVMCHNPYWRICTLDETDNPGAKAAAEAIVRAHNAEIKGEMK